MSTLSIATVTYNAEKNLEIFLPSIRKNIQNIDAVYVQDNKSSDDTVLILKEFVKTVPRTHISISTKNLGYAKAINMAIQLAIKNGAENILVTNNDLTFSENALKSLLDTKEKYTADAVGMPVLSEKGYFMGASEQSVIFYREEDFPHIDTSIDFPHGGTILFSKRFFQKIGLYDEELFFGGDEMDFLYRVKKYNMHNKDKIICVVCTDAAHLIDHRTKHDRRYLLLKATRMLQGHARVLLKHKYTPFSIGLYKEQWKEVAILGKKSFARKILLTLLSIKGIFLESVKFYKN